MRIFCLVQLPVEQLNALLQLIDLNIVSVIQDGVWRGVVEQLPPGPGDGEAGPCRAPRQVCDLGTPAWSEPP